MAKYTDVAAMFFGVEIVLLFDVEATWGEMFPTNSAGTWSETFGLCSCSFEIILAVAVAGKDL